MAKRKASRTSSTSPADNAGKVVVAKKAPLKPKKSTAEKSVFIDDRGLKFRFKKKAPATLNFDGKTQKIADIIKNEEIMLELVYGNSNYIEQIL